MEKPSVTLRHNEGCFLGVFLLTMTGLMVGLSFVIPEAQGSGDISIFVMVLMLICSVACFFWGTFTETLDETGILIKRPYFSKKYQWCDIEQISIVVVQRYKSKDPEFSLKIKNSRFSLSIAYTKRTMACITCYYGRPDQDQWGKPPILM